MKSFALICAAIFAILLSVLIITLTGCTTTVKADSPKNPIQIAPLPNELQKEQYTIVILEADWCKSCEYLKESMGSAIVKTVLKNQYNNDVYYVDVENANNREIVDSYIRYLEEPLDQVALPTIFILSRPSTDSPTGKVLISHKGAMSSLVLSAFLTTPARYKIKIFRK